MPSHSVFQVITNQNYCSKIKYQKICYVSYVKIALIDSINMKKIHTFNILLTEMKSHTGISSQDEKISVYTRVSSEFHVGMKSDLKESLPLSMMKTYNKIFHFSQLLKSEA